MATVGYTTTPSTTYGTYGLNTNNLLVAKVTMPEAGTITSVSAYVAAHTGSGNTTARLCVWNSSGTLLAQSADITLTPGSGGRGGQSWNTANLTSSYSATNGQVLYIGMWRHYNQSHEWTEDAGSTEYTVSSGDGQNGAPPSTETFTSAGGMPGIYATYTPGGALINTGNPAAPNWVSVTPQINTGTPASPTWTSATEAVNTGTPASPTWS